MPFNYTDIEDEVVTALKAAFTGTGYNVQPLPDKQADFARLVNINAALLTVAYAGSDFETPATLGMVSQKETVVLIINVKAAKLRGNYSISQALQILKLTIVGFAPSHCRQLYLKSIDFDERNDMQNAFSYNVTFQCKKIQSQAADFENIDGPLLKKIFWQFKNPGDFYSPDFAPEDFNTQIPSLI